MRVAVPNCRIRPMRPDDIRQVLDIERQSFPTMWPQTVYQRELKNKMARYFVAYEPAAERDVPESASSQSPSRLGRLVQRFLGGSSAPSSDRILGMVGLWCAMGEGHIVTIAVRLEQRRLGIGELLLVSALEAAMEAGQDEVTLEYRVSSRAARALYDKYGFNQVGVRARYYSDNQEDAVLMTTPPLRSSSYRRLLAQRVAEQQARWGDDYPLAGYGKRLAGATPSRLRSDDHPGRLAPSTTRSHDLPSAWHMLAARVAGDRRRRAGRRSHRPRALGTGRLPDLLPGFGQRLLAELRERGSLPRIRLRRGLLPRLGRGAGTARRLAVPRLRQADAGIQPRQELRVTPSQHRLLHCTISEAHSPLTLPFVLRWFRNMPVSPGNRRANATLLKLKGLLANGAVQSQAEAARALGLSRQRIHQLVREHDLALRKPSRLVTFRCAKCGEELTRQRSSLSTLKHPKLCGSCSRQQRRHPSKVTVTCQRCGTERRYLPYIVRRLTSGLCRRCWCSSLQRGAPTAPRVNVVCPVCGSERLYREKRAAELKTPLCQKCYLSRQGRYRAASHG